jgi:hypothetical protein
LLRHSNRILDHDRIAQKGDERQLLQNVKEIPLEEAQVHADGQHTPTGSSEKSRTVDWSTKVHQVIFVEDETGESGQYERKYKAERARVAFESSV